MLAIIGGSGLTRLSTLAVAHREVVRTPYGDPSSTLLFGQIAGRDAVFLARHGHGHTIPPHRVNYRANLWALKQKGAAAVVAVASVGGIRGCQPGDLVLPHQLIDYTSGREMTFFDGGEGNVVHVDFTHPYTPDLRRRCLAASASAGIALADGGVYGAVNGPRLETAAEIDRLDARRRDARRHDRHAGGGARARAGLALCRDLRGREPRGRTWRQRHPGFHGTHPASAGSGDGQGACAPRSRRHPHDPRHPPHGRSPPPRTLARSRAFRLARAPAPARRHARHDARARRRGTRRTADRRAAFAW